MSVVVDASLIVALIVADDRQAAVRTLDGKLARNAAGVGLPVELIT